MAKSRIAGLLLLLLGVGLVACGGGDKASPTPTLPPAAASGGVASSSTPPGGNPTAQATQATQPTGTPRPLPDACNLLTDSEVTAAMSRAIAGKRTQAPTPALSQCSWDGATGEGQRLVSITVRQAQFGRSVYDQSFKGQPGAQAVTGIGTEAIALPKENQPANNYRFLSGAILTTTLYIQIDVQGPTRLDQEALSTITGLMRSAAGRLP